MNRQGTSRLRRNVWALLLAGMTLGFLAQPMAVAMPDISGVVKDDTGKPVRGAVVSATSDSGAFKRVSRYTNAAGQYTVPDLKPGNYRVSASAWGLEAKESGPNLTADAKVDFTLASKWDPDAMMSWAEWLTFLPGNAETSKVEGCVGCHSISWTMRELGMRGATAQRWKVGIASMNSKIAPFVAGGRDPKQRDELAALLEKYFGPDAPLPAQGQVRHVEMNDAALNATWYEYKPRTNAGFLHSADADANGHVWFAMWHPKANKVGRLDPTTEEIQEISVPTPNGFPHTPLAGRDGKIYVSQGAINAIGVIDPQTGKYTEYKAPTPGGPHTPVLDSEGNIWTCDTRGGEVGGWKISKFDVRTHEFTEYVIPAIPPLPPDATLNPHWEEMLKMDRSELPGRYGLYGIGIDSHDNIWVTTSELGNVIHFNPKTKEWKFYPIPGGQHMKDVKADEDDNIWFSSHNGHRLGKIIPSTGEIKLYQMPTPYASTYGIVMDKRRGYLWTPDFSGGQITRFNLKTEEFTEYRFPTPHGLSRFIGLDPKGRVVFTESNAGVFGILDPGDL